MATIVKSGAADAVRVASVIDEGQIIQPTWGVTLLVLAASVTELPASFRQFF
jgi:hypothetical protein